MLVELTRRIKRWTGRAQVCYAASPKSKLPSNHIDDRTIDGMKWSDLRNSRVPTYTDRCSKHCPISAGSSHKTGQKYM